MTTYNSIIDNQEGESYEVTKETFFDWRQRRPLFIDDLAVGSPYLLFRVRPRRGIQKPLLSTDIEFVASLETFVSAVRSADVITFGNHLVFTYEEYGKEWFVLRVI